MRDALRSGIVLAIGLCVAAVAASQQAGAAVSDLGYTTSLQHALMRLADQARPGTLGITVSDLQSGRTWRVNAGRPFPMMSVFKAPLGATVLSQVDGGTLSLDQKVIIRRKDLRTSGVSRIAANFHGDRETFTVRQLLEAAVSHSDNTAADMLLRVVGGPSHVTAFLRDHGIRGIRVDRGEREIAEQFHEEDTLRAIGRNETPAQRDARLRQGYAAYLKDPRDRATPDAAAQFLKELWQDRLLTASSTRLLLTLLYGQTVPDRLRAGIPPGIRIADKCGTSYTVDGRTAAFNDIGVLTWPDGHTVIVAAFLTDSHMPDARKSALFKATAEAVVAGLSPRPGP